MSSSSSSSSTAFLQRLSKHELTIGQMYFMRDMLYAAENGVCPAEIQERTKSRFMEVKDDLDQCLSSEESSAPFFKPQIHYLMGKLLNIFHGYEEEAENHLELAAAGFQTSPHLSKVLVCLGLCDYKKGKWEDAKNKLERALELQLKGGGPSNSLLLDLSAVKAKMVLSLNLGTEKREMLCQEAIKHAKDVMPSDSVNWKDGFTKTLNPGNFDKVVGLGKSHYLAGVGHMVSWCLSGFMEGKELLDAIEAFSNVGEMKRNPKYRYNTALVGKYVGNYLIAITAFGAIAGMYNAEAHIESILNVHKRLEDMGDSTTSEPDTKVKDYGVRCLNWGGNKGHKVIGKVGYIIEEENGFSTYLLRDTNGARFVLLAHGLKPAVIRLGDRLQLADPYFQINIFEWKGESYKSKTVFLESLNSLKVNGKSLEDDQKVYKSTVYTFSFPKILV